MDLGLDLALLVLRLKKILNFSTQLFVQRRKRRGADARHWDVSWSYARDQFCAASWREVESNKENGVGECKE